MPAPINNDYALKFKTPEERQEICKKFCEHIEKGYSDASFPLCDTDTINSYIEKFPEDFPIDQMSESKRKRLLFWERIGISGTVGQIKGFNAKSWQFVMMNHFKWTSKNDVTSDSEKIETPIIFIPEEEQE